MIYVKQFIKKMKSIKNIVLRGDVDVRKNEIRIF